MRSDLLDGRKVSAIFFDFDGVIAESVDVKTKAFAKLFEEYGPEVVEKVVEHHTTHAGVSRFEKIRLYHEDYIGEAIDEAKLKLFCDRFSNLVLESVVNAPYVPGALELLSICREKYACFVISATPQAEMETIIERKNLKNFFVGVYGSPRKKTEIAEEIINTHSLKPDEIVYFGDALTDYEVANKNGFVFIGRVPEGQKNIFPQDVNVVPDLKGISSLL